MLFGTTPEQHLRQGNKYFLLFSKTGFTTTYNYNSDGNLYMRITLLNDNNYIQLRQINNYYFDFEILFSNSTDYVYFHLHFSFSIIQHLQLDLTILQYLNATIYLGTQTLDNAV